MMDINTTAWQKFRRFTPYPIRIVMAIPIAVLLILWHVIDGAAAGCVNGVKHLARILRQ